MPELPEVETIRKDLTKLIVGKKILDIETDSVKQIKPSLGVVKKEIIGASIRKIERRAKLLQIFLSSGKILVIHLKLTGRLLVRKKGAIRDKWQHVTLMLSGDKELRFTDLRKFGWVKLLQDKKELEKILAEFGPEPLDDLSLKEFKAITASTSRAIKVLLMDQKKISGIGNIYACDALFLAKIHPGRKANDLKEDEIKKLFRAIEKVLKAGIKYRGASDQYYLDALGHKGSYQDHFLVYGRAGKKCFGCEGKIEKIRLGGRGTYYCPKCQKQ
ncbi:bifunctional DNA-formamidopyrimidine glycosylase/DNA-(apurinic or apyrimidinic site) lyase [Patescibacteria group bacterium]|nr:bifunctional DNA-formamidopyrimidine glycosylase/DNA-(apurinic or apyrimidinic site) lyase [Patescibacteria group bacterium]MBU0777425.1 bifunctional DNA-formamidopyrimidine glycosylase/DNA-(apurinic or apyrimidinic site) lyase [Patescibacteria group bacterium]MBU0846061.1 bifunctional DNA-formamidopyrimidine glycosylase/DNA-(apurinic or apyrimidinic site) lyase [Patescibacteria group bacterium]MBU0923113.1 bifunctional DNA-formamidopyrimidine glycosylase/DNA-(apurinic or apyrimidinic site) l